jgi:MbtH protein
MRNVGESSGEAQPLNREERMAENAEPREETFRVVVNHEEQHSIRPARRELPGGWADAGKVGSKDECLARVEGVWTDMRPLSLRKSMAEAGL